MYIILVKVVKLAISLIHCTAILQSARCRDLHDRDGVELSVRLSIAVPPVDSHPPAHVPPPSDRFVCVAPADHTASKIRFRP